MYLGIVDSIRTFFRNLFSKFSYDNLVVLLLGAIIGALIAFFIYITVVLLSFKKEEKKIQVSKSTIDLEKIERFVKSAKNQFLSESDGKTTNEKIKDVGDISWNLINDIAREYFPKSKYPIYELSIDELLTLNHYITNRVDSLFKGTLVKPFKKLKLAYVLELLDMKKKIDENKAVKTASKLKTPWKVTWSVLNVFNPVYWVNKLVISTSIIAITNKIGGIIIEVVGDETNKVYSKAVFNVEKTLDIEIEKEIQQLEKMQTEEEM